MNWTIFFAVLILICLFARPAWWVFKKILGLLGGFTGLCKGISDVRKQKKLDKQMKGSDKYDVTETIWEWLKNDNFTQYLLKCEIKHSDTFSKNTVKLDTIWTNPTYWRQKQAYEELIKEIK